MGSLLTTEWTVFTSKHSDVLVAIDEGEILIIQDGDNVRLDPQDLPQIIEALALAGHTLEPQNG